MIIVDFEQKDDLTRKMKFISETYVMFCAIGYLLYN